MMGVKHQGMRRRVGGNWRIRFDHKNTRKLKKHWEHEGYARVGNTYCKMKAEKKWRRRNTQSYEEEDRTWRVRVNRGNVFSTHSREHLLKGTWEGYGSVYLLFGANCNPSVTPLQRKCQNAEITSEALKCYWERLTTLKLRMKRL